MGNASARVRQARDSGAHGQHRLGRRVAERTRRARPAGDHAVDADLKVTDAFGLRNTLFHSAPPGDEQEALPVPASLLVDRDGKVLWMDLSENYQRRSGPEVVLAALRKHLD